MARNLEAELDRCGGAFPDTRLAEKMTVRELLEKYLAEITPHKRSARSETFRIKALLKRDIAYRTLAMLSAADMEGWKGAPGAPDRIRTCDLCLFMQAQIPNGFSK